MTVHLVDETLDGGAIVLPRRSRSSGDDEETLLERLHAVEHRLLPRAVGLFLAGALRVDGRRVTIDAAPPPRRARAAAGPPLGLRQDRPGAVRRGPRRARLRAREHRRHGPCPARSRASGHGRRRRHGLPRDARRPGEDAPPARPRRHPGRPAPGRPPRAAGGRRHRALRACRRQPLPVRGGRRARPRGELDLDGLVEEIDIGGPSMVRAAAKNHASSRSSRTLPATTPCWRRSTRKAACRRPALGARGRGVPPHGRL